MTLAGRGILVTRPRELAAPLAELIEASGGRAVVFPAIEIEALPLPETMQRLRDFDLAVFVSPSAVRAALREGVQWPPQLAAAAVGAGTRRALEAAGVTRVVAPHGTGADSEALLGEPELDRVRGQRVLIVRGEGGRALLGETLAARGATVEYASCYRRVLPRADAAPLVASWRRGHIAALTVSSAEALDNLFVLLGASSELLRATPLVVSHARIAAYARARDLREVIVGGPGDPEMVERLVAYFGERP